MVTIVDDQNRNLQKLASLVSGGKYTIALMNDFGIGVTQLKITLMEVKTGSYAQYQECVQLIFKLKGKRKLRAIRLYDSKSFIVWAGWVDVESKNFSPPENSNGLSVSKSLYMSFDKNYLFDAANSVAATPLITNF